MSEWQWLLIVSSTLAAVGVYILWRTDFVGPKPGLQQRMQDFSKRAIEQAESEHGFNLDFSDRSIEDVDRILQTIHQRHQQTLIPERELSQIVLTWGGYVGIVLQRQFKGMWYTDSLQFGQHTYPLRWKAHEAAPVMWCLQRIRKGEAVSVVEKFERISRELSAVRRDA